MRKKLTLLCLFLYALCAKSQFYDFPNEGWQQSQQISIWNGYTFNPSLNLLNYTGDSLHEGIQYKVLGSPQGAFVRMENGVHYHGRYTPAWEEVILYDFSVQMGQVFTHPFYTYGTQNLTVIKKEQIIGPAGELLWYIELEKNDFNSTVIRWMEGVGDLGIGYLQFTAPDAGFSHICTLNGSNQTIYENSNPFLDCNCDEVYGEDNDDDGYRNHIGTTSTIILEAEDYPPLFSRTTKIRDCDTLQIENYTQQSLLLINPVDQSFINADQIIGSTWYWYNFNGAEFLRVTHQGSDVYYHIRVYECSTFDCDDENAGINSGAPEIPYNGIDEDCNPLTLDDDLDEDGFGLADDCDDAEADINPNATEVPYNGMDEDCNPLTLDDDLDEDGFGLAEDCDDQNTDINPNATEVPYNGMDEDCNPLTLDDDLDEDGFGLAEDCDDAMADINPNATEVPYNGIDEDCNPLTLDDDLDEDGFGLADDCDDQNADINPDGIEIPNNGIDEDCDGSDLINSIGNITGHTVSVFPNPAKYFVNINASQHLDLNVELFDFAGRMIFTGNNIQKIYIAEMAPGVYFLKLSNIDSNEFVIEKLMIHK